MVGGLPGSSMYPAWTQPSRYINYMAYAIAVIQHGTEAPSYVLLLYSCLTIISILV